MSEAAQTDASIFSLEDAAGALFSQMDGTSMEDLGDEHVHTGDEDHDEAAEAAGRAASEHAGKADEDHTSDEDDEAASGDAEDEQTGEETGDETLPPIEAPASWKAEEKEAFKSLPRALQETVERRERERDAAIRTAQNESATSRQGSDAQIARLTGLADQMEGAVNREISDMARDFPEVKSEADAVALAQRDPAKFTEFQARLMALQGVMNTREQAKQEIAANFQRAQAQELATRKAALIEAFPTWVDAEVAQRELGVIRDYVIKNGIPESETGPLVSPAAIKIIQKAQAYDKAQAALAAKKTTPVAKAPMKPGVAAGSKNEASRTSREAQLAKLAQSGDMNDAFGLMFITK